MIRVLVWLIVIWIFWKILMRFTQGPSRGRRYDRPQDAPRPERPPYRDIEDADFEDVSKTPDDKT